MEAEGDGGGGREEREGNIKLHRQEVESLGVILLCGDGIGAEKGSGYEDRI